MALNPQNVNTGGIAPNGPFHVPTLSMVLYPLTRGIGAARSLGSYEGHGAVGHGPTMTKIGAYTSPFAPSDLQSVSVLTDARNRVGF